MMAVLQLEVEKIHACQNDYMLFHNGNAMLEECRVCESSRYKRNIINIVRYDIGENKKDKRLTAKVVLCFPIIPHLKQLFANKVNVVTSCRGLVPQVPWVTSYGPEIQIWPVPISSKWLGNHAPRTGYGPTIPC
jgi:hypothetical protein